MTLRFVRGIAALMLAGSLVAGGATTAAAAGGPAWEQDGYGAGNTGYNPAEPGINAGTPPTTRMAAPLQQEWRGHNPRHS
jgi:hypothetical protein